MTTSSTFFALLAMLFWGIAPLFGKIGLRNLEPLAALTVRSALITAILLITVTLKGKWQPLLETSFRDAGAIALEGICAALLGQLAYYYALKDADISKVSPLVAAFPLVAVMVGMVVLGEKLSLSQLAGAVLIVAGVALINYR